MIRHLAAGLAALLIVSPAVGQTRFVATVTGKGPDVVMIPGLASSGVVWDASVQQLSGAHRVHVLQVKGFAGEPAGPNAEGPVLQPLVAEVADYVAKLDHPAIVGHSLGGLVAMEVAAARPDKVARVLIVDSLPFYSLLFAPTATSEMVKPQAEMMRAQMVAMSDAQFAAGQDRMAAQLAKSETAQPLVKSWSLASDRKVVAMAMHDDMVEDARPLLPKIKAKTTVLYAYDPVMGEQKEIDTLYGSAYAGLPGVELKRVEGSYHFIMYDQPKAFADALAAFLK